jgi:hypothetical protein
MVSMPPYPTPTRKKYRKGCHAGVEREGRDQRARQHENTLDAHVEDVVAPRAAHEEACTWRTDGAAEGLWNGRTPAWVVDMPFTWKKMGP